MNIDSILKPYEDSQPTNISVGNRSIERIPAIVDRATGQVTEEFQNFYNKLVEAIDCDTWVNLYHISDKAIALEDFIDLQRSAIGAVWDDFRAKPITHRGLDVELNLGRFQATHRNLIGGFYVIIYMIDEIESELSESVHTKLRQLSTEILFTYKDGEFKVLSVLTPFEEVEG